MDNIASWLEGQFFIQFLAKNPILAAAAVAFTIFAGLKGATITTWRFFNLIIRQGFVGYQKFRSSQRALGFRRIKLSFFISQNSIRTSTYIARQNQLSNLGIYLGVVSSAQFLYGVEAAAVSDIPEVLMAGAALISGLGLGVSAWVMNFTLVRIRTLDKAANRVMKRKNRKPTN